MKLVIDIPKSELEMFKHATHRGIGNSAMSRIVDGTPLTDVISELYVKIKEESESGKHSIASEIGMSYALDFIEEYKIRLDWAEADEEANNE